MRTKHFLYIIWSVIFVFEIAFLVNHPTVSSGFFIYTSCLLASIPLTGMADELRKFKQKQRKAMKI